MTRAERRKEIAKVSRFVKAAETAVNGMDIIPRNPWK